MITVYIWEPTAYQTPDDIDNINAAITLFQRDKSDINRSFGHVSLHVELEDGSGKEAYLSFCPDPSKHELGVALKSFVGMVNEKFVGNIDADRSNSVMGADPDHIKKIDFLNERAVFNFINDFKKSSPKARMYNFYRRNCSTLATAALSSGILKKGMMSDASAYAAKAWQVLSATGILIAAFKKNDAYMATKFSEEFLQSSNLLLSTVETMGARTPKTVLEYIAHLEKLYG